MVFLITLLFYTLFNVVIQQLDIVRRHKSVLYAVSGGCALAWLLFFHERDVDWVRFITDFSTVIVVSLLVSSTKGVWLSRRVPLLLIFGAFIFLRVRGGVFLFSEFTYILTRFIFYYFESHGDDSTKPTFSEMLSYLLYFPSLVGGPVFSFVTFRSSLRNGDSAGADYPVIAFRLLWGLWKFIVLATILKPFIPQTLVMGGFVWDRSVTFVSLIMLYVYTYLNFSGTMDIVIASSAAQKISLPENFRSPFAALNITEFWRRWHITLGDFLRALIFTPVQVFFARKFPGFRSVGICAALMLSMLAMGLWHAFELNFIVYGALHGMALCLHYLYTAKVAAAIGITDKVKNHFVYKFVCWLTTHLFVCFTLLVYVARPLSRILLL